MNLKEKKIFSRKKLFRGENMGKNIPEPKLRVVLYYQKNKEWLQDLARIGDPYIRAMALSVISEAEEILNQS
jgi:hypothetical protein